MTSRIDVITEVHDRFGALATTAGWTASETDYGKSLDWVLRYKFSDADITLVTITNLNDIIEYLYAQAAKKLRHYYMLQVDISIGSRRESFNQIVKELDDVIAHGPVMVGEVTYDFDAFTLASGDVSSWPTDWWQRDYENKWV